MRRPLSFAVIAALSLSLAIVASSVAGSSATKADGPTIALISDIGKFNDRGFNQNQLAGLNKAKTNLGITALAKQSNSVSDYIPNMTAAVRSKANLVIAAGFLLADATATMAKKFPDTHFAITDYPVEAAPFADKKGKPLFSNVEGLTYAANEGGFLVGVGPIEVIAEAQIRFLGGLSDVDWLVEEGLRDINSDSSRWSLPFLIGARYRF